ncbi:MAG: POTRA domain-containing protein [Archangium sp.]|nr:POTRA domain-containing protein [Archangium sp.]MDP3156170.1 POTRA domain-containing protein [Archangium sp.]MDP3571507.1 POTRA domain-containing protein [Archangium sp.]
MGVTLLFLALLTQTPAPEAPTIVGVEVRLPAGADRKLLERVPQLVTVRKGQALSRRAVERSIESLFATGKFADIEVQGRDVAEGVELVFILVPRQNIGSVFVEGTVELTRDEVIAASGLEVGSEYWPERAEHSAENVRALYRRRGFRAVEVRTEAAMVEGAVTIGFIVKEGEPSRVRAVSFSGEPGLPLRKVLDTLGVRPGALLDLARLETGLEAVRGLYRRERFFRARVDLPEVGDDGRVVVPVVSGPRYDLVFSGNRVVSDSSLQWLLAYDGEETLDLALAERLAQRIERFYRFRGYHDVRVVPSEVLKPRTTEAALGFSIEEGAPLRVVSIGFEGASVVPASELQLVLRRVMETSAPVPPFELHSMGDPTDTEGRTGDVFADTLPSPPMDTVFEAQAWGEAANAMMALYRERGHLKASVIFAGLELEGRLGRARFVVQEGPLARFRVVQSEGLPAGFSSPSLSSVKLGSPFSPGELQRIEQGVSRELGRNGYLFANVGASYSLDAQGRLVDALISVTSGPQVKVRAVLPVGQVRTAEEIITLQATMKEGQPLDSESLFSTQSNLSNLGIFRSVQVEMLSPDRPEALKTVLLKVRERPLFSGEFFFGYFFADGFRGGVEGSVNNIGGRAITLTGRLQGNLFFTSFPALTNQIDLTGLELYKQMGFRANLSLDARSILPAHIGMRLDLIGERVFRPQFRFTRAAAVPTLDWSTTFLIPGLDWMRPKISLALQYELEYSFVERVGSALTSVPPTSLVDQERLRFNFGEFALHGVRLNPTIDLRDSALTPTRGLLLQASGEVTGAISAQDEELKQVVVNFLKVSGLATGYVPFANRFVLAVSARGGRIFPLTRGSATPPVRRFFLGGATSVRGFNEDQLVADDLRAQYRKEVNDCQVLASKDGCSSAAKTILGGRQVPSQGGELFAVFKAELRFPAFSVLDLGVFFEAGNLWLTVPNSVGPFRPVVGVGVRYVTPIGALALDLGVNLAPDLVINEPQFVVHFNIGVF